MRHALVHVATPGVLSKGVASRTRHRVVVPVAEPDRVTLNALAYVLSLLGEVGDAKPGTVIEAVHVTDNREDGERMQRKWRELELNVPVVVLESPNRAAAGTLVQYIEFLQRLQLVFRKDALVLPLTPAQS